MSFVVEPQAEMRPGVIELRWGEPDPGLIPVEKIAAAAGAALRAAGAAALTYGANEGPQVLREALAERITRAEGQPLGLDEIVITAGNSAAIDQVLALFVRPGDAVLVEDPTYSLALSMARDFSCDLVGVPFDDQGMQVDALPDILKHVRSSGRMPRLLYTIPTFHNPTGVCLADERRERLVQIAAEEHLLIVEDDVYRELAYEGAVPASLWALAHEVPGAADYVVRLGTFSKTLAPGLRCGFLTAGVALAERIAQSGLYDSGGCPSQFPACLVAQMILDGSYDENVARVRSAYAERCRALLSALREALPAGCSVSAARGGFFTWVGLPDGLTASRVLPFAEAIGLSFFGDSRFSVGGSERGIRLAFTMYPAEILREAAAALGMAIIAAQDAAG
jgi:DNA-binding transcriptional MocR family regulator